MNVNIEVADLEAAREISFSALSMFHRACVDKPMKIRRSLSTNGYLLQCDCGLCVELISGRGGVEKIVKVAIGGEPVDLDTGSFTCGPPGTSVHFSCREHSES